MLGPQHGLSIIRAFIGLNHLNVVATHQEATIWAHVIHLRCDERSLAHLDRMPVSKDKGKNAHAVRGGARLQRAARQSHGIVKALVQIASCAALAL